jgi:group I intron endonuclease
MGYIYILTSPSGKSYIGQTYHHVERRFKAHQKGSSECVAIYRAIQKYGWENFKKDWYECPDEDLNFDEELLVREMETLAPGGYNLREGGGNRGKMSDETRRKMSEAQQGEKHYLYGKTHKEGTKKKMSNAHQGEKNHMYGKLMSEESKRKMSDAKRGENHPNYGKPLSDETKRKISGAQQGEKNHMYGKTGEKNPGSKKVYQYDLDGILIGSFGSCAEASRYLGKKDGSANISTCANGKSKTADSFGWSYTPQV